MPIWPDADRAVFTGPSNVTPTASASALGSGSGPAAMEVWRRHACARLVLGGAELMAARRYVNGVVARMRRTVG